MERLRDIDNRSLLIGLLLGISLVLAIAVGVMGYHQVSADNPVQSTEEERESLSVAPLAAEMPNYAEQVRLREQVERKLEKKVQTLIDGIIGRDRSKVRISVALVFGRDEVRVRRLSMALSVDQTKVILDPETYEYIEVSRTSEELEQLRQLAIQATGFDEQRGDQIVIHATPFDKTQELHARMSAQQEERKRFWSKILLAVVALVGLFALRWLLKRNILVELREFIHRPQNKIAFFLSVGLFFCAHGLGWWGESLSWGEIGFLPGLFLLIVGGYGIFQVSGAESNREDREDS
jgi:hypothetical protein